MIDSSLWLGSFFRGNMTVTITPIGTNLYKLITYQNTILSLTWDEVLGVIATMNLNELTMEILLNDLHQNTVTVAINGNYYEVIYNGQITKNLCWNEMLAQVVNLIHPQLRKPWFKSEPIPLIP